MRRKRRKGRGRGGEGGEGGGGRGEGGGNLEEERRGNWTPNCACTGQALIARFIN